MLTLWTLRRIADFLKPGSGVWYVVDPDGSIMFMDGSADPKESVTGHSHVEHFRNTDAVEISMASKRDWETCIKDAAKLELTILQELNNGTEDEEDVVEEALQEEVDEEEGYEGDADEGQEEDVRRVMQGVACMRPEGFTLSGGCRQASGTCR